MTSTRINIMNFKHLAFLIFLCFHKVNGIHVRKQTNSIFPTITYPNGHTTWFVGQTHNVTWNAVPGDITADVFFATTDDLAPSGVFAATKFPLAAGRVEVIVPQKSNGNSYVVALLVEGNVSPPSQAFGIGVAPNPSGSSSTISVSSNASISLSSTSSLPSGSTTISVNGTTTSTSSVTSSTAPLPSQSSSATSSPSSSDFTPSLTPGPSSSVASIISKVNSQAGEATSVAGVQPSAVTSVGFKNGLPKITDLFIYLSILSLFIFY
ncbi:hypothetical protein SISSUDRAFT_1127031 [Sistotremastrum suecicum HHB10207 ss-3]|uniref:Uncharacterized protein n=1 Tax=Sistotremastrum suecicum HHB10207 ss-3 TaxID=1314776 RepID=A0A166FJ20_9AGAM|nr:hypothetical protein SISSUDRAFT_1127031 [Sistotremastrum suecicum HHB10207 ss-3]